jgi:hypothetical protein
MANMGREKHVMESFHVSDIEPFVQFTEFIVLCSSADLDVLHNLKELSLVFKILR